MTPQSTTAPLDPAVQHLITATMQLHPPSYADIGPTEARRLFAEAVAATGLPDPLPEVDAIENYTIATPEGGIPVRLYWPKETRGHSATHEPEAAIAFFHGGGWVLGDLNSYNLGCRQICEATGALVMSVGYRLAPEFPYPMALNDCLLATRWLTDGTDIAFSPKRLVVAGDSAGGNLAAAVCLRAFTDGPHIDGQALIYPCLDLTLSNPSVTSCGNDYLLTKDVLQWFAACYLADHSARDPFASPIFTLTPAAFPPTYIATAGYDPLKDDGIFFATLLETAGISVTHHHFPDLIHGFLGLGSFSYAAKRATATIFNAMTTLIE